MDGGQETLFRQLAVLNVSLVKTSLSTTTVIVNVSYRGLQVGGRLIKSLCDNKILLRDLAVQNVRDAHAGGRDRRAIIGTLSSLAKNMRVASAYTHATFGTAWAVPTIIMRNTEDVPWDVITKAGTARSGNATTTNFVTLPYH